MLSAEENAQLTQVGPGTLMGGLLRRYWHPFSAQGELDERATKDVTLLGEELVAYRDGSGTYGLIDRSCPHRRVDLSYGIPEEHGLRCMYHGWLFDETGACTEQPFEETVHPHGRFKEKTGVRAYPVQAAWGLLWAYLGPAPAPLLPEWEPFTWQNSFRDICVSELDCNWLQCQENSIDPVHTEWLHAYWAQVQGEVSGFDPAKRHRKVGFTPFEHGIIYRRVVDGSTEEDDDWAIGRTCLFPEALFTGTQRTCHFEWRVPMDDERTLSVMWFVHRYAPGHAAPVQETIPYWRGLVYDEGGRFLSRNTVNQDIVAWVGQGPIMDRTREQLGESDRGIILMRRTLLEQARAAAEGRDPMNTFRDPAHARAITLPLHTGAKTVTANPLARRRFAPFQAGEPDACIAAAQAALESWV
ncbi:MAG: aromatic ring-hydroxylating dioxygenase subunit alpha [Chloroflexota bacterium]